MLNSKQVHSLGQLKLRNSERVTLSFPGTKFIASACSSLPMRSHPNIAASAASSSYWPTGLTTSQFRIWSGLTVQMQIARI